EGGCNFFVGKIAGVEIPKEQFVKLLNDKKTDIITGFLSKKGLFFDASLKLDENNAVVFDFN
ncbi:MAG: topoisomerase C-terminal repeat-containing protein, partial [Lachnospiraceae bacterium]|nr:topoisomerase C-terminal repeat-containing protein [Lachnospiraceae bacterium]